MSTIMIRVGHGTSLTATTMTADLSSLLSTVGKYYPWLNDYLSSISDYGFILSHSIYMSGSTSSSL